MSNDVFSISKHVELEAGHYGNPNHIMPPAPHVQLLWKKFASKQHYNF